VTVQDAIALNQQSVDLAQYIDQRLASQLAAIGLVPIMRRNEQTTNLSDENGWPLRLNPQVNLETSEIHWELADGAGLIRWSARERIEAERPDGVNRPINRVAFRVLGENGAVPLLLEREQGGTYAGSSCTTRAQLFLRVQDQAQFNEMRSCLADHLQANPNDPTA